MCEKWVDLGSLDIEEFRRSRLAIATKEDLASLIDSLRENLINHPSQWENPTLERFLDAMAASVRSLDYYHLNMGKEPPTMPTWATFAEILLTAKIYE